MWLVIPVSYIEQEVNDTIVITNEFVNKDLKPIWSFEYI